MSKPHATRRAWSRRPFLQRPSRWRDQSFTVLCVTRRKCRLGLASVDLSLSHIEARLAVHAAKEHSRVLAPKRAAVAALLRYQGTSPEVLLMQRATHEGDRWSGHVSFPGGREEAQDPTLVATAIRETLEEVGVNLATSARLLGQGDSIRAVAKGRFLPMSITPYFFIQTGAIELVLNHEAETAFWLPLHLAISGELDDTYAYNKGPLSMKLPCWRYEGHTIWGLTHQMLSRFLELIR